MTKIGNFVTTPKVNSEKARQRQDWNSTQSPQSTTSKPKGKKKRQKLNTEFRGFQIDKKIK